MRKNKHVNKKYKIYNLKRKRELENLMLETRLVDKDKEKLDSKGIEGSGKLGSRHHADYSWNSEKKWPALSTCNAYTKEN